MSAGVDPVETTAAILKRHVWIGPYGDHAPDGYCDQLAERIIAALQLIQETRTYEATEVKSEMGGEGNMRWGGQTIRSLGWRTESRLVGPWVGVPTKPEEDE